MPSISSILIGAIVALAIACGLIGWRYTAALEREGAYKAALSTALEANASLVGETKRAKADAAAEAERAMQRQRERDGMAEQVIEMRRVLGDDPCSWTAEKARALDKFLGGQ